jgi:3-hydroxybutyryl-CoA dehydrogenase
MVGRRNNLKLDDIEKISVIGAGIMGHGIALTYALGGYKIALQARRETTLSNAMRQIKNGLTTFAENGLIGQDMIEKTLSRITTTNKLEEAVKDADFVTETIAEDVGMKRQVFTDLDALCPNHTILASNTSSLLLEDFASQCNRQDKILLTHWMNPPHIVPAVEVVRGKKTSDETVDVIYHLLKKVKKLPVKLSRELPGLIINRVQVALIREIWALWQQGIASEEDIDIAISGSIGFRLAAIGPLRTCDFGGLDLWHKIACRLFKVISDAHEPPGKLEKMVEYGNLGLKSGKGFFDYNIGYFEEGQDESVKHRDKKFIQLLKLLYPESSCIQ